MQFKLAITGPIADLRRLEDVLFAADPAAMLDIDPTGRTLRVASSFGADQLSHLFAQAGLAAPREQFVGVPSECCGGCGG